MVVEGQEAVLHGHEGVVGHGGRVGQTVQFLGVSAQEQDRSSARFSSLR